MFRNIFINISYILVPVKQNRILMITDENLSLFPCSDIMNNKVFYQHPNLMRALGMHETVMEVMVNVLSGGDSKV